MLRLIWTVSLLTFVSASASLADILVFTDGSQMEVQKYEVKEAVVLMTTLDGQLRSVPKSYVDIISTEKANRRTTDSPGVEQKPTAPRQEAAPPSPKEPPAFKEPPTIESPQPKTIAPEKPATRTATAVPASTVPKPLTPPPVWTDEELKVSLVIPSSAWNVETQTDSFDVAVRLSNHDTGARATLALVRKRMRDFGDFQEVVREIETSLASSQGHQSLGTGLLTVDPYTAHELRYLKTTDGMTYYTRMVVYYSRDLAYVLSLTCLQDALEQTEEDFDALVSGLVIKKVRKDITPKGVPRS